MSEKKLVYIAGPVAGTEDAVQRFQQATLEVAALSYVPINPIEILPNYDDNIPDSRKAALKADIRELLECDGIYLLRNWENSRGARLEKLIADGLDMFILYQA